MTADCFLSSALTEWSRGDTSDMDGQVDRPSERARTSQRRYSNSNWRPYGRGTGVGRGRGEG